ncbi:hypothetical protein BDQ12DRAFT_727342 [Crucibulum laeve]|uniref:Mid2 domain-containing protein n=1 Tax=Crucibulum laeve TaxID=68775 RepID=A0A5C3LMI4_9AGAR|nr:hypothetical protein BDQ12DRAFT_727342 [Crucibulum laeve]
MFNRYLRLCLILPAVTAFTLDLTTPIVAGVPTELKWEREANDPKHWVVSIVDRTMPEDYTGSLSEDLIDIGGKKGDVGGEEDDKGKFNITFPDAGQFQLVALETETMQQFGMSDYVDVDEPEDSPNETSTASASASATATDSESASATTSPTRSPEDSSLSPAGASSRPKSKTAVIIGSIIGASVLLTLLVIFLCILRNRRREIARRHTFHKDMMVQRRGAPASLDRLASRSDSQAGSSEGAAERMEEGSNRSHGYTDNSEAELGNSKRVATGYPNMPMPYSSNMPGGSSSPLPSGAAASYHVGAAQPSMNGPRGPRAPASGQLPPRTPLTPAIILSPPANGSYAPMAIPLSPSDTEPYTGAYPHSPSLVPIPTTPNTSTPGLTGPPTERQTALDARISKLQNRIGELQHQVGMVSTVWDLRKEILWLREQRASSWARGETDVPPGGWERWLVGDVGR